MKHSLSWASLGGFALTLCLLPQLHGQDTKAEKDAKAEKSIKVEAKPAATAKPAEAAEKPKRRLPNNYGKLELSPAQRDKIYMIQLQYQSQIDEMESKLAELKTRQGSEVAGVLTKEQRAKLDELVLAAKKKKDDAKAKPATPEKPAAATPTTTSK
jgi:thiol:disulfide interchange protein